jgi:hypothetical protein
MLLNILMFNYTLISETNICMTEACVKAGIVNIKVISFVYRYCKHQSHSLTSVLFIGIVNIKVIL